MIKFDERYKPNKLWLIAMVTMAGRSWRITDCLMGFNEKTKTATYTPTGRIIDFGLTTLSIGYHMFPW